MKLKSTTFKKNRLALWVKWELIYTLFSTLFFLNCEKCVIKTNENCSIELNIFGLQVSISFAKLLLNSIRPGTEEQGRLPGTDVFSDISQFPIAIRIPGILIIRINSGSISFANANFIKERYVRVSLAPSSCTHDRANLVTRSSKCTFVLG